MTGEQNIRVIIFKEDDRWVAQCLEFDIGAQAEDLDGLMDRLDVAISLEVEEAGNNDGLPPAPKYYQDLWDKRTAELKSNSANRELALCA